MKAEMKAVVASLVVIALALTAVSGITYSWFSDEETADIDVKTGNIELGLSSLDVKVYGFASTDAKYSQSYSSEEGVFNIALSGIVDKDCIVVSVPGFTINTDIDINYYETCKITPESGFFEVNGVQTIAKQFKADDTAEIPAHNITIDFDSEGAGMDKTYNIVLTFNAAQVGKPIEAGVSTVVSDDGAVLEIPTGTSVSGTAKVDIPDSAAGTTAIATEATAATASESGYTTVSGMGVVSGIDIIGTDASGKIDHYLKDKSVTLTFVLDGKYCDADGKLLPGVAIYHGDDKFVPSESDGESISATYDSVLDRTTITVVTKQGFSSYFVTLVIKVGDSYYSTLSEAFAKAQSGDTITILADVTSGVPTTEANRGSSDYLYVNNDVTLDLKGNITFLGYGFRVDDGGDLTISGNGTITGGTYAVPDYENLPLTVRNGGQATINGGTFVSQSSAECIFVGGEGSKLVINEGTFKSTKPYDVAKGFLLNVGNSGSVDQIIVNGGVFYNYAPAAGDDVLKGSFLADGKHLSLVIDDEGRSVYTVEDGITSVTDVSDMSDLEGAFKLDADITLEMGFSNNLYIDLNGHSLTISSYIFFGGYLIISDSSKEKTGCIAAVHETALIQTLSSLGEGHFALCGGKLALNGGYLVAETGVPGCTYEFFNGIITGNSSEKSDMIFTQQGSITIYGGSFTDSGESSRCYAINSTGSMTVCGGTFTSVNGAKLVGSSADGDVEVIGGTFTGDQPSEEYIGAGAHVNHAEGSNTWTVTLY